MKIRLWAVGLLGGILAILAFVVLQRKSSDSKAAAFHDTILADFPKLSEPPIHVDSGIRGSSRDFVSIRGLRVPATASAADKSDHLFLSDLDFELRIYSQQATQQSAAIGTRSFWHPILHLKVLPTSQLIEMKPQALNEYLQSFSRKLIVPPEAKVYWFNSGPREFVLMWVPNADFTGWVWPDHNDAGIFVRGTARTQIAFEWVMRILADFEAEGAS